VAPDEGPQLRGSQWRRPQAQGGLRGDYPQPHVPGPVGERTRPAEHDRLMPPLLRGGGEVHRVDLAAAELQAAGTHQDLHRSALPGFRPATSRRAAVTSPVGCERGSARLIVQPLPPPAPPPPPPPPPPRTP